jgi:hypothetical protein
MRRLARECARGNIVSAPVMAKLWTCSAMENSLLVGATQFVQSRIVFHAVNIENVNSRVNM